MASNLVQDLVQEGDQVMFVRLGSCRVFQVRKNRQVYFEKNKFHVDELIGEPYGRTYEVQNGKLIKLNTAGTGASVDANVSEPTGDNRNLHDLDSNQKMSRDDIIDLKEKGLTGEEIIEELIGNSETFHNKTEFSKAKYLKKKKKRHILSFTVMRPSPRLVMGMYTNEPGKICNLRPDTLSQLLNYSNVMHGSRVVLVENCQGLVLSSVLQRLGGKGKLIQLVPDVFNGVSWHVVKFFSFTKEEMDNVYTFQMDAISSLKNAEKEKDLEPEKNGQKEEILTSTEDVLSGTKDVSKEDTKMSEDSKPDDKITENVKMEEGGSGEKVDGDGVDKKKKDGGSGEGGDTSKGKDYSAAFSARQQQRAIKEARHREAGQLIRDKQIDCLIIACKYNPVQIVQNMLEFMPPSKPVVVFCQYIDPLVTIYSYIKEKHLGLQVQLSETWYREYQVLPQRTHPVINMSGTGGYLLTFITCDPN